MVHPFRYTALEGNESYDKDVWRQGGSSEYVMEKWKLLTQFITSYTDDYFQKLYNS